MTTAARILYAHKWKTSALLTTEDWLLKMMEFAKMAKLTTLIREKTLSTFTSNWKLLIHFLCEMKKE